MVPLLHYYTTRNKILFFRDNRNFLEFLLFLSLYIPFKKFKAFMFLFAGRFKITNAIIKGLWHGVIKKSGKVY